MNAGLFGDPAWLPHRLLAGGTGVRMVHAPRSVHRAATFLDDDGLKGCETADVPASALPAGPAAQAPGFIFHSAFCCSTLLARAFDVPGATMALKEPAVLNDLAALQRSGRSVAPLLPPILSLLARPFAAAERVVVKPSNVANLLIEPILRASPGTRAVLMHAPLGDFLVSVAKKGMWGRIWMRRLYVMLRATPAFDPGFDADGLFIQTDLQIAALAWLQHQKQFAQLLARHGERLRTLDSRTLLARREETLAAVAGHLGLALPATGAADAFSEHSKRLGERYDASQREEEQAATQAAHAEEIGMVTTWAVAIARQFGVPLELDRPLLG